MMLSELAAKVQAAGDVHAYTLYLAEPDADGEDVDLASVGRVEIHADSGEVRVYPSSSSTDEDHIDPEPYMGMVLNELPLLTGRDSDMRLMAEVPLIRDAGTAVAVRLTEIIDLHLGQGSEEAWLLLRPASAFADGLLPD